MRLAVIPARGGSKRIPRKNIRGFCGKPMIAWSIEAALESGCFDRVIVSTDDSEIAETSRRYGAEVPFLRPTELSGDHAATVPVIAHAINWLSSAGNIPDAVCCLYATAPFVRPTDLKQGLHLLETTSCDYAFSVTSYAFPIQRALRIGDNGKTQMYYPEHANTRSQDLEEAWHDAGQFYWGHAATWLAETAVLSAKSAPVILPRYRVQDIDTLEDWVRAELMFSALSQTSAL